MAFSSRDLCAALTLILTLVNHSGQAADTCKAGTGELPVTSYAMRPRIDAKINGQDARFLVDSGAAFSVISSATAAQFNLRLQDAPYGLELRGFGGTVKPRMATVKDFLLAGFLLHNKEFLVVGSEVGGGGGGLLGQDFLQAFDVEYDLADGVIRLFRVENCKHAMLAYWLKPGQAYSVLDIESTSPSRPHTIAPVYVNGKKLRALFDTGAQVSVLSLRAAKEAGVNLETPGVQKAGAWGGIGRGSTETYIAPFASFKVGDAEEIQNTRLRIADTGAAAADMFIGDDFFLSHRLFVSNSQHKMYLTYNGGAVFNLESPPTEVTPAEAKQESQEFIDAGDLARRGAASADRRDYGAALADLTRAVELDPNEPEYVYRRAMVYLARKQPELALADLNQALSLKPDFLAALISRAEFRLGSQDAAGAAADLAAADRAAPSQSDTRYALAGLYERAEDFHGAIEQFDLWIANHRDDRRILGALHGRCWSRAMQGTGLDAAISDCNDALRRMEKKNAAAYSALLDSRGFVYLRSGELNKAVADFDSSLKLNPKSASALYGRGVAKSRMSNAAEGRADIAAATSLDPQIAEFFSRREIVP